MRLAIILNARPHGLAASKLQPQDPPCKSYCQEEKLGQIGCRRIQMQQAQTRRSLVSVKDDLVSSGAGVNLVPNARIGRGGYAPPFLPESQAKFGVFAI